MDDVGFGKFSMSDRHGSYSVLFLTVFDFFVYRVVR